MKPNFCVITTTYQRPEAILRCVASVAAQSYKDWQHIIVIDDPVSNYEPLHSLARSATRLTLLSNPQNLGKNTSVNRAFEYLRKQAFAGYVVFLDDDDWLAPTCLADFADRLQKTPHPWLVSERVEAKSKKSFTVNKTGKNTISYQYHCLIKKDFTGDATHCIDFASTKNIYFPLSIKNAEEWLYFAHVSTVHPNFIYIPKAGTWSEGYAAAGLTDHYHQNQERTKNAIPLLKETLQRRIFSPLILSYVFLRLVRSCF